MSESHRGIDLSPNVNGYFEEVVDDAVRARRVDTSRATKQYLAGLLGDYARGVHSVEPLERPLTFLLQDALEQTGAQRFERLRRIGDGVLYALGFFGARMTRRGAQMPLGGNGVFGPRSKWSPYSRPRRQHWPLSRLSWRRLHAAGACTRGCRSLDGLLL